MPVKFSGILPDLFAEGEAAVVNGKIDDKGVFVAEQVLAKHDETYTPPEVASMNKESDEKKEGEHKNDQAVCKGMKYGT